MELILWRHADAEPGVRDSERRLSAKGLKQAGRMAKWLRARMPKDVVIMASPAKRAQQTARELDMKFKTLDELGVAAAPEDILVAAGWPEGDRTVLVIGHQPTLGETAAWLMTGNKEQWTVKTGAVVWIARRMDVANARTHMRALISPDLI
jgi:phosphohistidine phosphatase